MRQELFSVFCFNLRKTFDRANGAIARCFGKSSRIKLIVCAGTATNQKLIAEKVTAWDSSDNRAYSGPLQKAALRKILTQKGICGASFTNSVFVDIPSKETVCCFGDHTTCDSTKCPFKKKHGIRNTE